MPESTPSYLSADEAATRLGITFTRFKVALWRHQSKGKPWAPSPVQGTWASKKALYRVEDIERMESMYPFKGARHEPKPVEGPKPTRFSTTLTRMKKHLIREETHSLRWDLSYAKSKVALECSCGKRFPFMRNDTPEDVWAILHTPHGRDAVLLATGRAVGKGLV